MIWYFIILFITTLLTAAFSWLPRIASLPTILGVDIDAQLTQGIGYFYAFANVFWPIKDVFLGALIILGYHVIKMILRFFLGHRAPQ